MLTSNVMPESVAKSTKGYNLGSRTCKSDICDTHTCQLDKVNILFNRDRNKVDTPKMYVTVIYR